MIPLLWPSFLSAQDSTVALPHVAAPKWPQTSKLLPSTWLFHPRLPKNINLNKTISNLFVQPFFRVSNFAPVLPPGPIWPAFPPFWPPSPSARPRAGAPCWPRKCDIGWPRSSPRFAALQELKYRKSIIV